MSFPSLPTSNLKLLRIERNYDCTIGVMLVDEQIVCYTLELPWRHNKLNISCIPAGTYPWIKRDDGTILLQNTSPRTGILIHVGNYPSDTQGCILPGLIVHLTALSRKVISSGKALERIKLATKAKGHITIKNIYH